MSGPLIETVNVTVDLPVFSVKARSLRRRLINVTAGGRIMEGADERVVVRALNGVSIRVNEGDRVGLVGSNGSGKSTLLRTLAGIYRPSSGVVRINGRASAALDLWTGLDPEASGEENIISLGIYRGRSRRDAVAATPEIAEFTELGPFLAMPVKTYSAGMVARLAFGVATCFEPDILLMDEWITAVDQDFLLKAQGRMHSYFSKARAVVIATHDQNIINRLCNRIIVLNRGVVESMAEAPLGEAA